MAPDGPVNQGERREKKIHFCTTDVVTTVISYPGIEGHYSIVELAIELLIVLSIVDCITATYAAGVCSPPLLGARLPSILRFASALSSAVILLSSFFMSGLCDSTFGE